MLVCVVDDGDKPCLLVPALTDEDFFRAIRHIGISDLADVVHFHRAISCDYGALFRQCPPVQLHSSQEATELQIAIDPLAFAQTCRTLWWQRWGGEVFEFCFDPSRETVAYKQLNTGTGNYRHIPFYRYR
jgi:hypothetical protein